jgi:alpha-galactosidase
MKRTIFLFILWIPCLLQAQDFVKTAGDVIILDNGFIHREISLSGNRLSCSVLLMNQLKDNFISRSREFSFTVNGKKVDGDSGWKLISADPITDSYKGKGIRLVLQSENDFKIKIGLNYLLYPGLPLVRKWISIRNTGGTELCIEDLNIEDLETSIDYVIAMVYHN